MKIDERTSGDVTILDVEGRLTVDSPRDVTLGDTVRRLVTQGRKHILLNVERVPHIDSSGLCDIVEAYTTTTRQGGSLKLLHLTARVRDLLVITKLLTILEAYDSEREAIASFGPAVP